MNGPLFLGVGISTIFLMSFSHHRSTLPVWYLAFQLLGSTLKLRLSWDDVLTFLKSGIFKVSFKVPLFLETLRLLPLLVNRRYLTSTSSSHASTSWNYFFLASLVVFRSFVDTGNKLLTRALIISIVVTKIRLKVIFWPSSILLEVLTSTSSSSRWLVSIFPILIMESRFSVSKWAKFLKITPAILMTSAKLILLLVVALLTLICLSKVSRIYSLTSSIWFLRNGISVIKESSTFEAGAKVSISKLWLPPLIPYDFGVKRRLFSPFIFCHFLVQIFWLNLAVVFIKISPVLFSLMDSNFIMIFKRFFTPWSSVGVEITDW